MSSKINKYIQFINDLIKKYKQNLYGSQKDSMVNHLLSVRARIQNDFINIKNYTPESPIRISLEKSLEDKYDREIKHAEEFIDNIINPPDEMIYELPLAINEVGLVNKINHQTFFGAVAQAGTN